MNTLAQFEESLARLEARMTTIEQIVGHQRLVESPEFAKAVTYSPALFRLQHEDGRLRTMRSFKCWGDLEVREAVIARHRQMHIHQAVSELVEEFGIERAPSKSALQRIWQKLDLVRGVA